MRWDRFVILNNIFYKRNIYLSRDLSAFRKILLGWRISIEGRSKMIHFKKLEEKSVLHNPLKDFEIDSQTIEYREDPLSGFTSFIRTGRAFWTGIYKTDEALLQKLVEET
jgi:hypothetical protein